jgi:hypothetical protein
MKSFASRGYLLRDARLEVRLAYTGFLVLATIGLLTLAAFQLVHVGPTPADVALHYRGGERAGEMLFPKTFRELVELTHFHAFVMGIVYLVEAHLLIATDAPESVKRGAIVLGFVALAGDLVGGWLVRYVSALFGYWQVACWLGEWIAFAAYFFFPMREMWFRRPSYYEE